MSLSLYDLWLSMGPFAKSIVVIMAVMSVLSWTAAFRKWSQLYKSQKETKKFAPEFSRFLKEEQLDGAIRLAEKQKVSHVARVLGEALAEVKPLLRDRATITAADINSVERAVEREMLIVAAELKRGLGILATTGATAPFVGLLGTVMGIVNAFTGMAASVGGQGGHQRHAADRRDAGAAHHLHDRHADHRGGLPGDDSPRRAPGGPAGGAR